MGRDWTIDTYVLYKAAEVNYDAIVFLNRIIEEKHRVTFDYEDCIKEQYKRCLTKSQCERKGGSEALKKWFIFVVGSLAQKYSGKLYKRYQVKLKKLNFDQSDWPFVAVCAHTKNKNLVSEDSDYSEQIKEYLKKEMNICVVSIQDSLKIR